MVATEWVSLWTSTSCNIHICFFLCGLNQPHIAWSVVLSCFYSKECHQLAFACAFMINDSLPLPRLSSTCTKSISPCRAVVYEDPHAQIHVRFFQMPRNNGFSLGKFHLKYIYLGIALLHSLYFLFLHLIVSVSFLSALFTGSYCHLSLKTNQVMPWLCSYQSW